MCSYNVKLVVGFKHVGTPILDSDLLMLIMPQIPVMIVILVIEHIAIAKNFGKQSGYQVDTSQEILAQATANILGPFLGGYSCTGSFGASAVLSKAGVKTPLAGGFSALVLVLALYALTGVFYYIPKAALAGLIIHAVLNLIAGPRTILKYWQISPLESMIWILGVVMAVFTGLETSIYVTIALSLLLLLLRIARTDGQMLGTVIVESRANIQQTTDQSDKSYTTTASTGVHRNIFLPLNRTDASNPSISVSQPESGVFAYRFPEGLNYLNQALHYKRLSDYVFTHSKKTKRSTNGDQQEPLWCDFSRETLDDSELPFLKAIVVDCSTINSIDITSVQGLIDLRNTFDRWAHPSLVNWHFAGLHSRWARRSLARVGFGRASAQDISSIGHWAPVCAVTTSFGGATEADQALELKRCGDKPVSGDEVVPSPCEDNLDADPHKVVSTQEEPNAESLAKCAEPHKWRPLFALDRPFFHVDLEEALEVIATTTAVSRS